MSKIIKFMMKPINKYIIPSIFIIFLITTIFFDFNMGSLISGISVGIYFALFALTMSNKVSSKGPITNTKLLLSIKANKKDIIKSWYIVNNLSIIVLLLTISLSLFIGDMFTTRNNVTSTTYLILTGIALIYLTIFNLQTPQSFKLTMNSKFKNMFLLMIGLILLIVQQILFYEISDSIIIKSLYLLLLLIIYIISTYFTFKKTYELILKFEL